MSSAGDDYPSLARVKEISAEPPKKYIYNLYKKYRESI